LAAYLRLPLKKTSGPSNNIRGTGRARDFWRYSDISKMYLVLKWEFLKLIKIFLLFINYLLAVKFCFAKVEIY